MADRWVCPACGNAITLFVPVLEPPHCASNKHLKHGYRMVLQESEPAPTLSNGKEV